jgi:hypothetical protein
MCLLSLESLYYLHFGPKCLALRIFMFPPVIWTSTILPPATDTWLHRKKLRVSILGFLCFYLCKIKLDYVISMYTCVGGCVCAYFEWQACNMNAVERFCFMNHMLMLNLVLILCTMWIWALLPMIRRYILPPFAEPWRWRKHAPPKRWEHYPLYFYHKE